jgi:hypothetical protein
LFHLRIHTPLTFDSSGISVISPGFGGLSVVIRAHTAKFGISPQEFPGTLTFNLVFRAGCWV